jgi:CRP/FNR family transcriptional regulator, cyclic AMP receptor protein
MSSPLQPERPLAGVPLFAGLPGEVLDELGQASRVRRFPKGQVLCSEGDPGDSLIVLEAGRVRISRYTAGGQEVVLATVAAPAVFGELALIDGAARSATIQATEPVGVRLVERAAFLALLEREPAVARGLLLTLAGMVRATNERLTDLVALDVPGRLAKWLLAHAEAPMPPKSGDPVVPLTVTQTELATELGTTRVSVNRALRALEEQGAISVERDRIVVRRREILLTHAG